MTTRDLAQTDEGGAAPASSLSVAGLVVGETLAGKYLIEKRLAEGGMGVVLRATHVDLDCPVAIKVIRAEHVANDDVVARLLAEARIAACLRSKHINHVLDVGRTPSGVPYLVLEYMQGCDLGGYLDEHGPLPIVEVADYVLQACEALAEAHALGIVHRDLKPENLFLSEEADGAFVLKILDFGISKAPAARRGARLLTNPFEVVGSPTYMAPEQIRGGVVDERTDIWALGTVLYELVTGDLLFGGVTVTETFSRIVDEKEPVPELPAQPGSERLHAIISRCLRRNPSERFQDVVELARALAPLGSDELQAGRVARVAAATQGRARGVREEAPAPAFVPLAPLGPLGVPTISELGLATAATVVAAPKSYWRYGLLASSVMLPLLVAVAYAHYSAPRLVVAPVPAPPVANVPVTAVAATPVPAVDTAPMTEKPTMLAASVAAVPSIVPGPVAGVGQRAAVTSAPAVRNGAPRSGVRSTAAAASSSNEPAATDAWDPNSFGGRR
jgi:serine/threonine-protein kinase